MAQLDVVYPRIETARSIVEEENAIIDTEVTALDEFADHVRDLEPTARAQLAGVEAAIATKTSRGIDTGAIRDAYRDSLLGMAHYEDEYDEPLLDHVEGEFGPTMRTILGSTTPIAPMQRNLVLSAVEDAVSRRTRLSRILANEIESLDEIERRLAEIERRFHRLVSQDTGRHNTRDEVLDSLVEACESIAADRQRAIHRRAVPRISGIGERSLVAYLYGVNDHRFPALVEIADVASQIDRLLAA